MEYNNYSEYGGTGVNGDSYTDDLASIEDYDLLNGLENIPAEDSANRLIAYFEEVGIENLIEGFSSVANFIDYLKTSRGVSEIAIDGSREYIENAFANLIAVESGYTDGYGAFLAEPEEYV